MAVAHLVAAMVSHPIVWVVAPVVCIAVVGIPVLVNENLFANTGYGSVVFAWSMDMAEPSGNHTATASAVTMRTIFFCIVSVSCILAASRWSTVRSGGFTWRRVVPCVALVAPPLIIAALGVVMPVPLFRDAPLAFGCSSHEDVRVCVMPAHRSLALSYAQPAQRVVSVMPPTAVPHDVLLAEPGYHARSKQFVMDLGHATVYDSAQQLSDMTAQGLAQSFSGQDACTFSTEMTPQQIEAFDGVNSVERTILRLAGFQYDDAPSSERNDLDGMDVTAFRQWYTHHRQAIEGCSLTSSDLHR